MQTETRQDVRAFHAWLGGQLQNGGGRMSLDEAVAEFRAYLEELERCRGEIRQALEESLRGESEPLDMAGVIERVTARLNARGIVD